jgi:1,4-dihydroxy-2-naphthoyl-CoA synthase
MRYVVDGEQAAIDALGGDQVILAGTEDAQEGVDSFKERRKGNFKGR